MLQDHLRHSLRDLLLVQRTVAVNVKVTELLEDHLHKLPVAKERVHVRKLRLELGVHVPCLERGRIITPTPLQTLLCRSLKPCQQRHSLRRRPALSAEDLVSPEGITAVADPLPHRRPGRATHPAKLCVGQEGIAALASVMEGRNLQSRSGVAAQESGWCDLREGRPGRRRGSRAHCFCGVRLQDRRWKPVIAQADAARAGV
mmetsp:Transcript_5625/g.17710  ORF Transcript_5625/g.17710 Transcript_5625/m.17710 type:complete len:202 (-) Transcript_5625:27-632(-)